MTERWIRISDLYARDDVRKMDGYYCVSLSALSASLEQLGFKIVPVPDGHGAQGEPATPNASGHETAVGGGVCEHGRPWCNCGAVRARRDGVE